MHFVDTHCHLDLFPDYTSIIEEIENNKIYTIAVTNTPSVFEQSSKLSEGKKFIRTALGMHPQLVFDRHRELDLMISLLNQTKYVGEVGLDFSTNNREDRLLQEKVFTAILHECAKFGDKILTIHSRRATSRVIDLVGSSYNGKIILHWFSGSKKELERAISYGYYFSVNLSMTSTFKGRELVASIPLDRLLTESDGPFLKVNGKPATPSSTEETLIQLAELFHTSIGSMKENIYNNFINILS